MPDIFSSPSSTPTQPSHATSPLSQAFSSFIVHPSGIRFQTQQEDETILLLLRRHWVTNVPWIVMGAVLIFIPLVVFPVLFFQSDVIASIPASYLTVLNMIWYLFTFSYIFMNFLLWYFTVSIITQERIIDIDFHNIFKRHFSETRIINIEDVTETRGGFLRTLFNYGDVLAQTAANKQEFEFDGIPRPEDVVRLINNLLEQQQDQTE